MTFGRNEALNNEFAWYCNCAAGMKKDGMLTQTTLWKYCCAWLSYKSADCVTGYASVFTQTVNLLMSFGLQAHQPVKAATKEQDTQK